MSAAGTTARIVIVVAVEAEANAIGHPDGAEVVVAGVGRTNAALTTTRALLDDPRPRLVLSAGVAGALPDSDLDVGDVVVATESVYAEEGIITPEGFRDAAALGFPLGDFPGNAVPGDGRITAAAEACGLRLGRIATVATCSGTDGAAAQVTERTGAIAEAMEGAAVVHVARTLGVPAGELRAISNTTGDRDRQRWDLRAGLDALGSAVERLLTTL